MDLGYPARDMGAPVAPVSPSTSARERSARDHQRADQVAASLASTAKEQEDRVLRMLEQKQSAREQRVLSR